MQLPSSGIRAREPGSFRPPGGSDSGCAGAAGAAGGVGGDRSVCYWYFMSKMVLFQDFHNLN